MGWSYSGNPGASNKDAVRFLIQDTNTSRQLVQDEEIEWMIGQEANIYMAASQICTQLVVKGGGGGVKRKKVGDLMIEYDTAFYRALAGSLSARGVGHQVPYAGGISKTDKQLQQTDPDWVKPKFARDMENNPAAPQPQIPPGSSNDDPLNQI